MKILVIIPCYNEEENIEAVVARLQSTYPQADYLVVNDCSTDHSRGILHSGKYNFLDLPVNLGIGGGVQSGYLYAVQQGYDITVQMDGDGQHNPKYLPDVIAPVAAGELDGCIGSRFITKEGFQTSVLRRFGIHILSFLIYILTGAKVRDVTSGFRACNKQLTAFYARHYAYDYPEPEAIISGVMNGFTLGERPVIMEERAGGQSSIRALSGAYYMIKVGLSLLLYRIIWRRSKKQVPENKPDITSA